MEDSHIYRLAKEVVDHQRIDAVHEMVGNSRVAIVDGMATKAPTKRPKRHEISFIRHPEITPAINGGADAIAAVTPMTLT